jgi:hypothetical protein
MTRAELAQNPFFVLELATGAAPMEVERAAQRLLALLAIGASAATSYRCPLGAFDRDEGSVRQAAAALRDPKRRLAWEFWAELPGEPITSEPLAGWPDALCSVAWRGPWGG